MAAGASVPWKQSVSHIEHSSTSLRVPRHAPDGPSASPQCGVPQRSFSYRDTIRGIQILPELYIYLWIDTLDRFSLLYGQPIHW